MNGQHDIDPPGQGLDDGDDDVIICVFAEEPGVCRFVPTSPARLTLPRIISTFPSHSQRTAPKIPHLSRPPPLFHLNDFLQMSQSARGSLTELRNLVLSTCNYKKLLDLFLSELHRGTQREVTNQIVSCEGLTHVKRRIPHTHIICGNAITRAHVLGMFSECSFM